MAATGQGEIRIHDLERNPLAIIPFGSARITNNHIRILHRINIDTIRQTITSLDNRVQQIIQNKRIWNELIKNKIGKLHQTFEKISPPTRVKRWERLGSLWKYISGSPDAEDLRIVNYTENSLINQNNRQISINYDFESRINSISNYINTVIDKYDNLAANTLEEFDIVNFIFNIDELLKQLENIEQAIDLAKKGIPNSQIISLQEIKSARQLLNINGLETDIIGNVLDKATSYVIYNKDTIIYTLKIPRIKKTEYTLNYIEPVTVNKSRIHLTPRFYLRGNPPCVLRSLCPLIRNVYICESSQLEQPSECIKQILTGETAKCPMEHSYTENDVRRINDANILINNGEVILTLNCSTQHRDAITRVLKGSFLIQYHNCKLRINDEEFSNMDVEIPTVPFIPTTGLKVNSTVMIDKIPLEHLQKLHLEQRNHINFLNLTTENLHWNVHLFGWLSFGSLSTIVVFLIGVTGLWMLKKTPQKATVNITIDRSEEDTRTTSPRIPRIPLVPQDARI